MLREIVFRQAHHGFGRIGVEDHHVAGISCKFDIPDLRLAAFGADPPCYCRFAEVHLDIAPIVLASHLCFGDDFLEVFPAVISQEFVVFSDSLEFALAIEVANRIER